MKCRWTWFLTPWKQLTSVVINSIVVIVVHVRILIDPPNLHLALVAASDFWLANTTVSSASSSCATNVPHTKELLHTWIRCIFKSLYHRHITFVVSLQSLRKKWCWDIQLYAIFISQEKARRVCKTCEEFLAQQWYTLISQSVRFIRSLKNILKESNELNIFRARQGHLSRVTYP